MAHQGGHAALAAFGIPVHQLQLLLLLLALRDVRLAPVVLAAADVFREIDNDAAVNPEFFESLVEFFRHAAQPVLQRGFRLRLGAQLRKQSI